MTELEQVKNWCVAMDARLRRPVRRPRRPYQVRHIPTGLVAIVDALTRETALHGAAKQWGQSTKYTDRHLSDYEVTRL